MTEAPQPNPSRPPIDPQVQRRTLTIVIGFFALGVILAVAWVSREIQRVRRMERIPTTSVAPSNPPPAAPSSPQ